MTTSKGVPAAIFAGCCVIAIGLYMGLSARPIQPLPKKPIAPPAVLVQAKPSAKPVLQPRLEKAQIAAAQKAAQQALDSVKAGWIKKCWAPAIAKTPKPDTARWTIDVTFNAAGIEIARGISDIRGSERADVARCLRTLPLDLRIPPQPRSARATLMLTMP